MNICKFDLYTCSNLHEKLHCEQLCVECVNGDAYQHIDDFQTILKGIKMGKIETNECVECGTETPLAELEENASVSTSGFRLVCDSCEMVAQHDINAQIDDR